jgi:hypothetical protein
MYSDDELYKTCKHESFHCLRAITTGQRVISVDITEGVTFLVWGAFSWELPRLVREDPLYAEGLVKAVISSCVAPSVAEHTSANPNDVAAYTPFLQSWPRSAAITRDTLYRQACAETIAWLAQCETKQRVRRLAEKLFCYRHELLQGETLTRVLAPFSQSPPAPPVAGPVRPTPRPMTTAAQRDLENLIAYYGLPATTAPAPERSTTYAEDHRPNGRYRPLIHYAA